jgi:hypothetical protein
MVDPSSKAEFIKATSEDPNVDNTTKQFATANLAFFALLVAVVEKAVIPLANSPRPTWNRQHTVAPKPDPGKKKLADVLAAAEKTAIIFDANLGTASIGNKDRLAHTFSAKVQAKAIAVAGEGDGSEEEIAAATAEAIRVADDALSCTDMSFLGQATKVYTNSRDASDSRNGTFYTMPIKFVFPDKSSRIHFQRTMREKCKLKATMSLPLGIRKEAEKCRKSALEQFPGEIVMVRAESDDLQFAIFLKKDGDRKWVRSPISYPIPVSAVLPEQGDGAEEMES